LTYAADGKNRKGVKILQKDYLFLSRRAVFLTYELCGKKLKRAKFGLNTYINLSRGGITLTYKADKKGVIRNEKTGSGYGNLFDNLRAGGTFETGGTNDQAVGA